MKKLIAVGVLFVLSCWSFALFADAPNLTVTNCTKCRYSTNGSMATQVDVRGQTMVTGNNGYISIQLDKILDWDRIEGIGMTAYTVETTPNAVSITTYNIGWMDTLGSTVILNETKSFGINVTEMKGWGAKLTFYNPTSNKQITVTGSIQFSND